MLAGDDHAADAGAAVDFDVIDAVAAVARASSQVTGLQSGWLC